MAKKQDVSKVAPVNVARAIRRARRACGLTQKQLGQRLQLKDGQAAYRWERGTSAPSPHNRKALVALLGSINPAAGAALLAEIGAVSDPPLEPRPNASPAAAVQGPAQEPAQAPPPAAAAPAQPAVDCVVEPSNMPSPRRYALPRPQAVDYLVLCLADELDVSPRRLRRPLLRFLKNLHANGLELSVVTRDVQALLERTPTNEPATVNPEQGQALDAALDPAIER